MTFRVWGMNRKGLALKETMGMVEKGLMPHFLLRISKKRRMFLSSLLSAKDDKRVPGWSDVGFYRSISLSPHLAFLSSPSPSPCPCLSFLWASPLRSDPDRRFRAGLRVEIRRSSHVEHAFWVCPKTSDPQVLLEHLKHVKHTLEISIQLYRSAKLAKRIDCTCS